jgi:diguanylate cyclase (GGDEF)-like protein
LEHERNLARTDYLTGAVNSRYFYEFVQTELDRVQRYEHPFTVVYIDLDNFKLMNDQFGHATGDVALQTIVRCAQQHLRKSDIVARLGGDEFALLLPETNQAAAQAALTKIQQIFLAEMQQHDWPVTLSIGALTYSAPASITPDALLKMADSLMYRAKTSGKNTIKSAIYPSPQ